MTDFSIIVHRAGHPSVHTYICMVLVAKARQDNHYAYTKTHRYPYKGDVFPRLGSIANRMKDLARRKYDQNVC